MTCNADFFTRYDAFMQQETALVGTDEKLSLVEEKLAKLKAALGAVERQNKKHNEKLAQRRALIELCQTSWFYGVTALQPQLWLRGGVAGKIARQEAKLESEEAESPSMETKESQLKRQVGQHEKEVEQLESAEAQKDGVHAQCERMFDEATAGAPTPTYQQLVASKTQAVQTAEAEKETVRAMEEAAKKFEEAVAEYGKAANDMNAAARENGSAQHNVSHMAMAREMDEQQRDRMMNYARGHANAGAAALTQAAGMIPAAARSRHPEMVPTGHAQSSGLSSGVAQATCQPGVASGMASMLAGGLGAFAGNGGLGDMIVGGGINAQLQEIAQSKADAGKQLGQAQALLSACKQDAAAAAASASHVEAQLRGEKQQIFNALREQAGAQPIAFAAPGA